MLRIDRPKGYARIILLFLIGVALICFAAAIFSFKIDGITYWQCFLSCPAGYQCLPPLGFGENAIIYPAEMSLRSSEIIEVHTGLYSYFAICPYSEGENIRYEADLLAPGFDVEPSSVQQIYDQIDEGSYRSLRRKWSWVIQPADVGTYELMFTISAYHGNCEIDTATKTFEISVVNLFGLTALQSNILAVLSGFLGSALTLPGILTLWEKLKKKRADTKAQQKPKGRLVISAKGDEKEIDLIIDEES